MKMKRNALTIALVLVLGLTLFTAATVAASSTNVGYEAFKTTMEGISHEDATTGQVNVSVTDNGELVFNLTAEAVGSEHSDQFSALVNLSDGVMDKAFKLYGQEDAVYIVDLLDDGHYMMPTSEEMKAHHNGHGDTDDDRKMTSVEEELLDYFVGDLKDNFVVKEAADGSKVLSFNMEANEVPTGLNLMIKAATSAEHRTENKRDDQMEKMPFLEGFDADASPDLTEDVQLDQVAFVVHVDADNMVTDFTTTFAISGKDDQGDYHEVVVNVLAEIGYEAVDPETIDAEAYDWELIEHDESMKYGHRR